MTQEIEETTSLPVSGITELPIPESFMKRAESSPETTKHDMEMEIADAVWRLEVNEEARRLHSENKATRSPAPTIKTVKQLGGSDGVEERIAGLVPSGSTVNIVGPGKAGKTTFMISLCKSLLSGEPFLGQLKVKPVKGKIAYLNYEMSEELFRHYCEEAGLVDERFEVVSLRPTQNYLDAEANRVALAEALQGCDVIVVDSFAQSFSGESENSNSEFHSWYRRMNTWVRQLVGAAEFFIIMHAGKDSSARARGASSMEDVADVVISLKVDRSGRTMESRGRWTDFPATRMNFDPLTSRLTIDKPPAQEGRKNQDDSKKDQILRYVQENPGKITNEIREAVGGNAQTVINTLRNLVDDGLIYFRPAGRNGKEYHAVKES